MNENPLRDPLIEYRMGAVEKALLTLTEAMQKWSNLEIKQAEFRASDERAILRMNDHDKRIRELELEMPTTKLARNWVIAGVLGVFGVVFMQVIKLVGFGL